MAKGDVKADPRRIIRAHRATYVDVNTGRRLRQDYLLLEGLPAACAAASIIGSVRLVPVTTIGLVTVAGLLSAFLFQLMIQVADRAESWADSHPSPGPETSAHAIYLSELSANAGYTSLVSIFTALVFVIASATGGWTLRVSSAVGIGLGIHLVLTLLMVMKRVFAVTEERLIRARTGAIKHP